jgi:hypothetical protein
MKKLILTCACLLMLSMPATAAWDFEGWEVKTIVNGSIKGDVFISYGDKSGLGASPYTSNFSIPDGTEKYSRLYIGVWGGTEKKTGTLNTVFNSIDIGTITIGGKDDTNPTYTTGTNVYGRGNGVWWASYNVTGNVTMGEVNTATAKTGGTIDGRVYAIVLVTVYTDPSKIDNIQYWINEGSINLHYKAPSYPWEQDKSFVWFKGTTAITPSSARLNAVYLTGTKDEPDYLYFNPPDESDSPYSNMAWDIAKYEEYQLDGSDVADASNGEFFDFETFVSTEEKPIKDLILNNNYAVFWRGHDDNNDGTIYSEFDPQGAPLEGESYVGPVLAVLVLEKAASVKPDLVPTEIKPYHCEWCEVNIPGGTTFSPSGDPWFNLTNYVNVTVNNTGTGDASNFKVKLYADTELIGEKTIGGLAPGSSTDVKFEWKPAGKDPLSWVDTHDGSKITYTTTDRTYTLKAEVDDDDEIAEENETNNSLTKSQKVVWNGYTGDQPLQNYIKDRVKGGMLYTTGDGAYQGVGAAGTTYGTYYNITYDLEIPGTPELSRLYIYYTWAQSPTPPNEAPKMGVTLTTPSGTHTLSMDKGYNDYKGEFGTWNYLWGTYAYDITEYVAAGGNYKVSITNLNDGSDENFATEYAFAAPAILVVYENTSMRMREYWINEGADLLMGGRRGDGGYLAWWECMNNATFEGSVSSGYATLGIVSPWADYASDDEVYFNNHSLGRGIYCGYNNPCTQEKDGLKMILGTGSQVSIDASDVTSYLITGSNRLTQADDGDNMMPVNAFLLVEVAEEPDFSISVSPNSASVVQGGSASASVEVTGILSYDKNVTLGASGIPANANISFTPENGKLTFNSTMLVNTSNTTPSGSYPVTITGTGEDGKVHDTIFTLKVTTAGAANASVSLRTTIIPAVAIEVTPSSINFGELSPGETSGGNTLTVTNKGGTSINVSAEVTDIVADLFVEGMQLNDTLWSLYSAVIPRSGDDKPIAKLHVPEDYAGVGSKEGTLMFWAEKS